MRSLTFPRDPVSLSASFCFSLLILRIWQFMSVSMLNLAVYRVSYSLNFRVGRAPTPFRVLNNE